MKQLSRRTRFWLILTASLVAALAITLTVLPEVLRRVAVSRLGGATGRQVSIEDVDFNLFTRRLAVKDFVIADHERPAPLLRFQRLDARLRLLPLFIGRLEVESATLREPALSLVRTGPSRFNVSDLLTGPSEGGAGLHLAIDRLALENGTLLFEDRVLIPAQHWEAEQLSLELRRIGTREMERAGAGALESTLEGAEVSFTAEPLRLNPPQARAVLTVRNLPLGPFLPYLPSATPVRLDGGRLSTTLTIRYGGEGTGRADLKATVDEMVFLRRGQADPFATIPSLAVTASDLTLLDGRLRAERIVLEGDPTVVDALVSPPQRFAFRPVRLVATGATWPPGGPASVEVAAVLPGEGTVEGRGTLDLALLEAALDLRLDDLNLARLRPYLPAEAPFALEAGRLQAGLHLRHADGTGTAATGDGALEGLVGLRRGQADPFLTAPRLTFAVQDLVLHAGGLTAGRLELQGAPTVVDASVTPAQRFPFTQVRVAVADAAWPRSDPAGIEVEAGLEDGASLTVQGTVAPAPLAADLEVSFDKLDLRRARPYLPPDLPVEPREGRLAGTVTVRHGPQTGTRAAGTITAEGLALLRPGQIDPIASSPRLTLAFQDVALRAGAVTAASIEAEGRASLVDGRLSPPQRLDLDSLRLVLRDASWPPAKPAGLQLTLGLPQGGSVSADGTLALDSRSADLRVVASDVQVGLFSGYLPIHGRTAGSLDADLEVAAALAPEARIDARGTGRLLGLELGPQERPMVSVQAAEATGLEVRWPGEVHLARLLVRGPSALIEREPEGNFPLREILGRGSARTPPAAGGGAPGAAAKPAPTQQTAWAVGQVTVEEGEARFIDRTTSPFYSEEISGLALTIEKLSSAAGQRARLAAQGVVGGGAAFNLRGEVAPFGESFFLDLAGEMQNFAVPRVNPYARSLLDWIAKRGSLTTKVHYRVVGDQLNATNEIVVERLDVAHAGAEDEVKQRVGLPLGLVVALLKNARGEIHLSVPVTGRLGAPEFSFGNAIATAVRNVVVKAITAPFRLLGKLATVFQAGDKIDAIKIDPLRFDPGSAVVSPALERELQRVADFLRASPFIRFQIEPLVSAADLQSLQTQAVTERIQRVQREQKLANFAAAAAALFRQRFPDRPLPKTPDEIVAAVRAEEPRPEAAAHELASRRLEATRDTLVKSAGIKADRLLSREASGSLGSAEAGGVRFQITTAD